MHLSSMKVYFTPFNLCLKGQLYGFTLSYFHLHRVQIIIITAGISWSIFASSLTRRFSSDRRQLSRVEKTAMDEHWRQLQEASTASLRKVILQLQLAPSILYTISRKYTLFPTLSTTKKTKQQVYGCSLNFLYIFQKLTEEWALYHLFPHIQGTTLLQHGAHLHFFFSLCQYSSMVPSVLRRSLP